MCFVPVFLHLCLRLFKVGIRIYDNDLNNVFWAALHMFQVYRQCCICCEDAHLTGYLPLHLTEQDILTDATVMQDSLKSFSSLRVRNFVNCCATVMVYFTRSLYFLLNLVKVLVLFLNIVWGLCLSVGHAVIWCVWFLYLTTFVVDVVFSL